VNHFFLVHQEDLVHPVLQMVQKFLVAQGYRLFQDYQVLQVVQFLLEFQAPLCYQFVLLVQVVQFDQALQVVLFLL
jgi:hypothetical protein